LKHMAKMHSYRDAPAGALSIIGVVMLTAGLLLSYTSEVLFNADSFADRAAASLKNPDVAAFAAGRITDAVISQHRDATPYRPLILGLTDAIVHSDAFGGIIRRAARKAHEMIMSGETGEIPLTVSDVGIVLRSALAAQPELADKIPGEVSTVLANLKDLPVCRNLEHVFRRFHLLAVRPVWNGLDSGGRDDFSIGEIPALRVRTVPVAPFCPNAGQSSIESTPRHSLRMRRYRSRPLAAADADPAHFPCRSMRGLCGFQGAIRNHTSYIAFCGCPKGLCRGAKGIGP